VTLLLRLPIGVALAWCVALGVLAPETPLAADLAAIVVILLTAWRPAYGVAAVLVLAPAGVLLAPVPSRVGELLAWAFVSMLLLRVWRAQGDRALSRPAHVRTAAVLFGACVVASWCGLIVAGAAGVEPGAIPRLLAASIRADHLLFSSAEPETWTMLQVVAGLALFAAAMKVVRSDHDAARIAAWALVASGAALAVATEAAVLRDWARADYGGWFLWRYARGERFSLHLADLNAAGSLYALSGLSAAALATADLARRWIWLAAAVAMVPALWLTGSRSAALGAILIGVTVIPLARRRVGDGVTRAGAAAVAVLAMAAAGANVVAAGQSGEEGSARSALRMRSEFFVTSARMFASAPVFGVGVGHYHQRSAEFMPESLRAVYPFENAHNYFAQQFAELGLVGGALFLWLVIAGLRAGWKGLAARSESSGPLLALVAGCAGYLLTCVTGHPLLVPETALPFWAAFGVMAAFSASGTSSPGASGTSPPVASGFSRKELASDVRRTIVATLVLILLVAGVALQAFRYTRVATPPTERGFHETHTTDEGVPVNWMTRHGVFYIGAQPGFLVVPVRTPDLPEPRPRPFVVDVALGGRLAGSYEIEPGRWNEIKLGLRTHARTSFRRVDLRANQSWTRRRDLGLREGDDEPRSVMVGDVRWEPAGSR
jgi:O-antigen ligase